MSTEPIVFVVDEDHSGVENLAILLRGEFPRVQTWASPAKFLANYEAGQAGCLVIEAAMATVGSIEILRRLQDRVAPRPAPPVIFVTGQATVAMAVEAMRTGVLDFLEMPVTRRTLCDSVQRALEHDRLQQARLARRLDLHHRFSALTAGERAVLDRIMAAKQNKEIAASLHLSVRTVEDRRANLMKKLRVNSLVQLVQLATEAVLHEACPD